VTEARPGHDAVPGRADGRHVAVTGAGTGIGRAIALRLAGEGARLSLIARGADRLHAVADEIVAGGGQRPFVAACDIRDRAAVDGAVAAAAVDRGPLHAFIANSGIGGPNVAGRDDRFEDLVQTNLVGTYWCLRAAERHLAPGPAPRHLIVTSSILARIAVPGHTGYSASKAGLLGLVRSLAAELAPAGVRVNAILPGWVDTDMSTEGIGGFAAQTGRTYAEALEDAMSQVPLRRMSAPEEIAGTVAWLLSDDARSVTGQGIDVNNGAFMR
jgi:NAD(P)-dependent dehydrogenase (short-subunit alcohol dehydrogenase family)